MSAPPASRDDLHKAVSALAQFGSQRKAAASLGISRSTLRSRLEAAELRGISHETEERSEAPFSIPQFPEDGLPAEVILEHMAQRSEADRKRRDAMHWFPITMRDPGPMAICWFGDPHLGNNGCDIRRLLRDVEAVAKTPHCYGANIGDTVDNWGGRLIRLYADNDVSRATERKLASWFLKDSGISWLVWLLGNHDVMDGALSAHMQAVGAGIIQMNDWRARFRLVWPGGQEVRIDAAHNHKGHSMWNDLHGQERAAVMDEPADLFIAGHHHTWGLKQKELAGGRVVSLARARGYKFGDDHAERNGFFEHKHGCSIVTVIDPNAEPIERIKLFGDVMAGLNHLDWARERWQSGRAA